VDNIKINLRVIAWSGMDCVDLDQDRDRWKVFTNVKVNLQIVYSTYFYLFIAFLQSTQDT
jgi:hypothetical protein